jgi:hypothetical protein
MPEKPPKEAAPPALGAFGKPSGTSGNKPAERPGSVGSPQAPSLGGDGEVKKSLASFQPTGLDQAIANIVNILAPNVYEAMSIDDAEEMKSLVLESVFSVDDTLGLGSVLSSMVERVGEFEFTGLEQELEAILTEEGLSGDTANHINDLEQRIQEGFPEFLGKAIVYTLTQSDNLLHPVDVDGFADFADLVEEVSMKVKKALPDYLSAHIGIELQNIVEEMRAQELELPEPIRVRSLPRQTQQPINVTVNPANITMPNINLPEITVNVPAAQVEVNSPDINITPVPITVESPTVNISVPERETNIQVDVPKQDAPIVNMSQPDIQINVPQQAAPVVNVEVSPTPVTIENTVHLPAANKTITIVKDSENTWHGEATTEK